MMSSFEGFDNDVMGGSYGKDYGFYRHTSTNEDFGPSDHQQEQGHQQENVASPDRDIPEELAFNMVSPSFQVCFGDIVNQGGVAAAVAGEEYDPNTRVAESILQGDESEMLSMEEIVKFAGVKFIKMCSLGIDPPSEFGRQRNLSDKESQDVRLVELLLFCAEKVHYQQLDRASKLLGQLSYMCSNYGSPIERLVYYFMEALRERIDRETGRISDKHYERIRMFALFTDMKSTISCVAYHRGMPFMQIAQFTGVQAIVDNVSNATRIHVIDLQINLGFQWTGLMQALALRRDRAVELLKITAVGTSSKHMDEEMVSGLTRFAESINIPFEFKVVVVEDMLELRKEHFAICPKETVVVYSQFFLRSLIPQPDRLEALMKVIRSIRPRCTVVIELDANLNSPAFVNRFIDCLFFHGAFFDCLEACVDKETRKSMESMFFAPAIKNIVAAEGEERKCRNVTVDVWKAFFSRFGMAEVNLSDVAIYQANLVAEQFRCGKSCTFDSKGKSLIVGWKGTPVQSISLFKFTKHPFQSSQPEIHELVHAE